MGVILGRGYAFGAVLMARQPVSVAGKDLVSSWRRTAKHLEEARRAFSGADHDDALMSYDELVAHNELGLALDALVRVAEEQGAGKGAWRHLAQAASEMKIGGDDPVHGVSCRTIDGHLDPRTE